MASLSELVLEYLRYSSFSSAASALEQEISVSEEGQLRSSSNAASRDEVLIRCMKLFDDGDLEGTFQLWNEHLSSKELEDPVAVRLQFYLHIYFSIYPLISDLGESECKASSANSMTKFRKFLETQGAQLAQTSEFLPYYALPFVPDPSLHPSFKAMFQPEWKASLRSQLHEFISNRVEVPPIPKLVHMFESQSQFPEGSSAVSESTERSNHIPPAISEFAEYHSSFLSLLESKARNRSMLSLDLIADAKQKFNDLTNAISTSLSNVSAESDHRLEKSLTPKESRSCSPEALSTRVSQDRNTWNMEDQNHSPKLANAPIQLESPRRALNQSASSSSRSGVHQVDNAPLDFHKVKADLLSLPPAHMCALLQALRWRLSKCRTGQHRRAVLQQYIDQDILECNRETTRSQSGSAEGDLLSSLLRSDDIRVRESCVRFLNTISSDLVGRAYLLKHRRLIPLLCMILTFESSDTITHQHALGALQKLSLRRQPQTEMIELGLVEYLIRILVNVNSLSEYSTEYGTALLMNLSLRTKGKQKAEQSQVDVLGVLNNLVEHENSQVRTYINGTLYSVLTRPALKERAREMGLHTVLSYLMDRSNEYYQRQITYILQQLDSEPSPQDDLSDNNENEEDADNDASDFDDEEELEDDDDDDDELSSMDFFGRKGEDLLRSEYVVRVAMSAEPLNSSADSKPPHQRRCRSGTNHGPPISQALVPQHQQHQHHQQQQLRPMTSHLPIYQTRSSLRHSRSQASFPKLQHPPGQNSRPDFQLKSHHNA